MLCNENRNGDLYIIHNHRHLRKTNVCWCSGKPKEVIVVNTDPIRVGVVGQSYLEILRPGGRTIAGPGIYQKNSPIRIFSVVPEVRRTTPACVTVANVGEFALEIRLNQGVSGSSPDFITLNPGDTETNCLKFLKGVVLACIESGEDSCLSIWRVDQYEPAPETIEQENEAVHVY